MALNTIFSNRIIELIGSDYSTIASNSYIDLFNAAISEVADMIPSELLLKYAVDPIDLSNSPDSWTHDGTAGGPEGKKILLVLRRESSGGVRRECTPVSISDYYRAMDTDSIYLATKHTPIYAYVTNGGNTNISLFPLPTADETAMIHYFAYPTTDKTGATSIEGLPNEIEQAVVLKACVNILQTYISDFCQDEEDSEMLQMLNGQIQSLQALFKSEMSRYVEQDATPRGE
jgi:hypothetical protein